MDQKIKDLSLLLMFLCGWEEDSRQKPGEKIFRAWKGYLFEVLNKLADEKLIVQFQNTKSVTLTEAGKQKARQLKEQIFSGKGGASGKW
jgi:DNA-binding PadR family transcriptional regulator